MFASRPAVHPMEVAAPANPAQQPPGVLMKDLPAMPGTLAGLSLRVMQLLFAAVSLAVMSSTSDFASVSAFCPYGAIYDERFLLPAGALSAYLIIGLIYLKIHAEVLCNLCDGRIISAAKPRRPIQITDAYISNESLGDQGLLRQRGVP